jgi:hypothetical protein
MLPRCRRLLHFFYPEKITHVVDVFRQQVPRDNQVENRATIRMRMASVGWWREGAARPKSGYCRRARFPQEDQRRLERPGAASDSYGMAQLTPSPPASFEVAIPLAHTSNWINASSVHRVTPGLIIPARRRAERQELRSICPSRNPSSL